MARCIFCNEELSLQEIWYPYKHRCVEQWEYFSPDGSDNDE